MKKREKLLRIRPYNMANFSGGSGYMPLVAIFGAIASFPVTLIIWMGMAISLEKEDGTLDYQILKIRLNRTLLPICLVFSVIIGIFLVSSFNPSAYGGSIKDYGLAILWGMAIPALVMYGSMFLSSMLLNAIGHLSKAKWFLLTLAFAALLVVLSIDVLNSLVSLGDSWGKTK